jgi:hypothetical protein
VGRKKIKCKLKWEKPLRSGSRRSSGDYEVPGDVLILLGENGLISSICETGEWPKDFFEIAMITLKKPEAAKCSKHCTVSHIALTMKIVAGILRRRFEGQVEDVLGEDHFVFRGGKGTSDAIGMLRIISE